jgi:hypothetical protein
MASVPDAAPSSSEPGGCGLSTDCWGSSASIYEYRPTLIKEINLAVNVPGWTRFKAAQQWLDARKAASSAEMKSTFEQFLHGQPKGPTTLTSNQRAKLFSDFLTWWQAKAQLPTAQ